MKSLPQWPIGRLLSEAVSQWNLRHSSAERMDWRTAEWDRVQAAVFAFVRHALTDYDSKWKADPASRPQLRQEIASTAIRTYPWLRTDPRSEAILAEPEPVVMLPLNEVADDVTYLVEKRHQLLDYMKHKTKPVEKLACRHLLAEVDRILKKRSAMLPVNLSDPSLANVWTWDILDPNGAYYWQGYEITNNYLHVLDFRCSNCNALVAVTKRKYDCGQGKRLLLFSCHCISGAMTPPPPGWTRSVAHLLGKYWPEYVKNLNSVKEEEDPHVNLD